MQTKIYKESIKIFVKNETYSNTYTFFSDYEEFNGQPKNNLIFLSYDDFDNVIVYFFDELISFLRASGKYNNIGSQIEFDNCVKSFFVHTAISSGKLSQVEKDIFSSLKLIDNVEFDSLIDDIKEVKLFFKEKYITKLFNKIRDNYGAYLQMENEIYLCPYCERNYVNIIEKKSLIIKPDLDHFYPKAKYPFLAASLENLVPSCQVCNSRLKKEIDFYKIKHSHPLIPSENIFKKINFVYLGNKNIYIKDKASLTPIEKQYIETFKIEEVYNTHTEVLDEILEKNKRYNYVKKHHLLATCPSLSEKIIKDIVFFEYLKINHKKTPLSSLKKSLFKEIVK